MEKLRFDPLSDEEIRLFVAGIVSHLMMRVHYTERVLELLQHYHDDCAFRNRVHDIIEEMVSAGALSVAGRDRVLAELDEYS